VLDMEKTFQRVLTAHCTGSDGRRPFDPEEEKAILQAIRLKRQWPAFRGSSLTIGLKGFRGIGFHEKEQLQGKSSSTLPFGSNDKKSKRQRSSEASKQDVANSDNSNNTDAARVLYSAAVNNNFNPQNAWPMMPPAAYACFHSSPHAAYSSAPVMYDFGYPGQGFPVMSADVSSFHPPGLDMTLPQFSQSYFPMVSKQSLDAMSSMIRADGLDRKDAAKVLCNKVKNGN